MKRKKEINVKAFNDDIKNKGRYQYANFEKYSIYIATKRQTEEIVRVLKLHVKKNSSILDVGCGDGTFTFEIYKRFHPKIIIGFDDAKSAINVASKSVKTKDKKNIIFLHGNVYNAHRMFKKTYSFDVIVIRGVLHHLYNPQQAIKSLSQLSNKIIVLEPNGYNPMLKIIERTSPYHIKHEEKSYWPPTLNKWFRNNNFTVREQSFFSIVPYFCPEKIARLLKRVEPYIEKLTILKLFYCGTNLIYYEK